MNEKVVLDKFNQNGIDYYYDNYGYIWDNNAMIIGVYDKNTYIFIKKIINANKIKLELTIEKFDRKR
jgi:effector-binding domain-containing protein